MAWKTWLYVATQPAGQAGAGANLDGTKALADVHHLIIRTYFILGNPLIPYALAGVIDSGHRIVLAFSDGRGPQVIGTYVAIAAADAGLAPLHGHPGLRTTGQEVPDCWASVPQDVVEHADYQRDPFLHVHCGLAVQRLHGATVPRQVIEQACANRADPQHALNPWPIDGQLIHMPGEP